MLDKCLPSGRGSGIWIKMMEKEKMKKEAENNSRGICEIGSNDMTATCTNMSTAQPPPPPPSTPK